MAKYLEAKINYDNYDKQVIRTVEAHTEGEYCRVALDCPELPGNTMIEKKHYLEEHYDYLRTMLMFEPRGHHDMFGAILCEPINPEADFGIFFMDGGGYLNMCGHCSIGAATVILEAGLMEMKEPMTQVVIEAPAGLIHLDCTCKNGKVTGVKLTNVPAFVYKENLELEYQGKKVVYDICFGGSFFALVDVEKNFGFKVTPEHTKFLTEWSSFALQEINKTVPIQHPELDITSVDLIENYCTDELTESAKEFCPDAKFALKNQLVFGEPHDPQIDRSPCGTGTSAKLSWLYKKGELGVGESFVYKSFIDTRFIGTVAEIGPKVGEFDTIIPQVTGAAYLCGEAKWFMDPDDKMTKGFAV